MKFISPARCRGNSKSTLLVLALLASVSMVHQDECMVQAAKVSSEGIFDRLEKKMGEKERMQAEYEQ